MTIPIRPGPFSFLQTLGEAGGKAFEAHIKDEDKKRKQAQDELEQAFKGRLAGFVPLEWFSSDHAKKLYHESGFAPMSSNPTTGEALEQIKRRYLAPEQGGGGLPMQALGDGPGTLPIGPSGPGSVSDEQRLASGLPSKQAVAQEKLGAFKAGKQLNAGETGTPGQQAAVTGVPTATTAETGEQGAQDPTFNSVADRVVRDIWARTGKIPSPQDALTAGQSDIRAKPYGEQLNEPYYGAAIRRLTAEIEAERTSRIRAYQTGTQPQPVIKDITGLQRTLNDQINNLTRENEGLLGKLSPFAKIPGKKFEEMPLTDQELFRTMASNNVLLKDKREQLQTLDLSGVGVVGARVAGAAGGQPHGGISEEQAAWDAAAKEIQANPKKYGNKTPAQVLGKPRP